MAPDREHTQSSQKLTALGARLLGICTPCPWSAMEHWTDGRLHGGAHVRTTPSPIHMGDGVLCAHTNQKVPKRLVTFWARLSVGWHGPGAHIVQTGTWQLIHGQPRDAYYVDGQLENISWPPPGHAKVAA